MLEFEVPVSEFFAVFGVNATFQRTDLTEIPTIVVIDDNFDRENKAYNSLSRTMISNSGNSKFGITLMKSDINPSPTRGDQIIVNTTTYAIESIEKEDIETFYVLARKV